MKFIFFFLFYYISFTITNRRSSENEFVDHQHEIDNQSTASVELCNHYQLKWNELHRMMESNVNLIVDSQKCLKEINHLSTIQLQSQQNFNAVLRSLNEIENGIEILNDDLSNVVRNFETVERLLKNYEKMKHEENLQKLDNNGQMNYQKACKSRQDDFDTYKLKLVDDHNKKAKEIEKLQSFKLKQKSHIFQNNFEKEIQEFKRTGKIPNRTSSIDLNKQPVDTQIQTDQPNRTLEDIDVETDDQDLKALDDFLNN